MAYAQGKYANGICDRCGQQYKLNTLKKEWTGFKVCVDCYEPKHPQLLPKHNISDAIALREPRPDGPSVMDVYVKAPGDTYFAANGMMPVPMSKDIVGQGSVGLVQVVIT
jgi:NAD-dependent SIR2 family protein deacetylase